MKQQAAMNQYGDELDPFQNGPLIEGNCFSQMIFIYALKVLKKGNQKFFTLEDCWEVPEHHLYGKNWNNIQSHLKKYPYQKKSFLYVLFWWIFPHWIWVFLAFAFGNFFGIILPYMLRAIINWIQEFQANPASVGNHYCFYFQY